MTLEYCILGMLVYFSIWAITLVRWYGSSMRQIERNHEIAMKRIRDNYDTDMARINERCQAQLEQAREKYKQSTLKYDLIRTIAE
jgi:hypothetical protein